MNKNFFKTNYSKDLLNPARHLLQKDGYAYATIYPTSRKLMLVLDDITYLRENYNNKQHSRAGDGVKCVSFLDKGIMTVDVLNISSNFQEIWYVNNWSGNFEVYNKDRFDLEIEELSLEQIVSSLRRVFYLLQPTLQGNTLAGGGESYTPSDPNFYNGTYYLKDGEEYTILKKGSIVEFYKGKKEYTYMYKKIEERTDCIYREEIDFTLYEKAIELMRLKRNCSTMIDEMMAYNIRDLKEKLDKIEQLNEELHNSLYH